MHNYAAQVNCVIDILHGRSIGIGIDDPWPRCAIENLDADHVEIRYIRKAPSPVQGRDISICDVSASLVIEPSTKKLTIWLFVLLSGTCTDALDGLSLIYQQVYLGTHDENIEEIVRLVNCVCKVMTIFDDLDTVRDIGTIRSKLLQLNGVVKNPEGLNPSRTPGDLLRVIHYQFPCQESGLEDLENLQL